MKDRPLVSVIIPVYNAGEYLEDCLRSVINQTYKNLEIILVDDGSTDGSSGICDLFAEKENRISVVHQKNSGASAARKRGILLASGDYICFVDADDRIQREMVAFFVDNIDSCDIITSGCSCEDAPGQYNVRMDSFAEGIYDTEEKMAYFYRNMIAFENRFEDGVLPFLVNKMYRAEIVKNAVQSIDLSIVYAEDRDLLFRCLIKSKRIRVVHKNFYDYRFRPDSIMRTVNKNFMMDLNRLYVSLEKVFAGHKEEKSLLYQLQMFLLSRMYAAPYFMGFTSEVSITGYALPFSSLEKGSRVVLYGAGTVGMRYYRQIYRQKLFQMVLWIDKNWKQYADRDFPVSAPEKLAECEYDYIIIAVKRMELAKEIKKELTGQGIKESRILWREPAVV